MRVEGEMVVIKDIPAYVCENCEEAYFTLETLTDKIMDDFYRDKVA